MAEFGSPTDVYGSFSRIEVDLLGFDEAAVKLNEFALYIDQVALPLEAAKEIAHKDMAKRFATETDPEGIPWMQLDPEYAARKTHDVGFEHPILTRSGELKRKALDPAAWTIAGDSLFFSTADLPEYWRVHQEGSSDFGAAFHRGVYESLAVPGQKTESPAQKEYFKKPGADHQQNIPPRPFIGLSDDAEYEILSVFDAWFSEGLQDITSHFVVSSAGVLQHRVAGGRFGPKVAL